MFEGLSAIFGRDGMSDRLHNVVSKIPPLEIGTYEVRKKLIEEAHQIAKGEFTSYVPIIEGRTVYDIFIHEGYAGNSRMAHCTVKLKGEPFKKWLLENFSPSEVCLYMGFDYLEGSRLRKAQDNWSPYQVKSLLSDPPYYSKQQIFHLIDQEGIDNQSMYEEVVS